MGACMGFVYLGKALAACSDANVMMTYIRWLNIGHWNLPLPPSPKHTCTAAGVLRVDRTTHKYTWRHTRGFVAA